MFLRPNFGALGVMLAKKLLQRMLRKRGSRPDGNRTLLPWQKAPGGRPTIKNCSNKKQLFGHMLKQLFEFLPENVDGAEHWSQNRTLVPKMWIGLKIEFKIELVSC